MHIGLTPIALFYSVNLIRQPGTDFIKKLKRQKLIVLELLKQFNFYKATVRFDIKLLVSKQQKIIYTKYRI